MSGHSKWSTIKRKKGANDAQRAKEFTKIARMITVAAQNGGGDTANNPALVLAIEKARRINMPNDNIDRAIKRGTGEGSDKAVKIEEVSYEAYGPGNVALIIDCTTDNRNRTVNDLRSLIEKHGGRMVDSGALSWQFKTEGNILIEFNDGSSGVKQSQSWKSDPNQKQKLEKSKAEEFELELYDLEGVTEVISDENGLEILTDPAKLNDVRIQIETKGILISEAELIKTPTNPVNLNENHSEKLESFIELIESNDDVQKVWSAL